MSDEQFDEVQKLIRLKRYEEPPAGYEAYTERFVEEFGRRQRSELLQRSSRGIFWERVSTYVGEFGQAKWVYASATAAFVAAAIFFTGANWGGSKVSGGQIAEHQGGAAQPVAVEAAPSFTSRPVTIPGAVQPVSTRPMQQIDSVESAPSEIDGANVIIYREF